ncbi:phosphatidylinositol mannoside acyltransferase [Cellulomonas alba]|uniref:Phosphatidylinositol mannoside acyltransferase n=1 Tax=Cellulomonas alba TaxID=3053467 RepID=A0ABT7SB84_9CELL|nr:phosphatidylinositol mannoside acyltransferase [Cellulomonas alba]MDM7853451.1 phosphatidylinositol mannoside acyltransferase [Cellulomonas alba]
MKVDVARAYATAWRVAGHVPGPVLRFAGNVAADVTWLLRRGGVRQLEKNLARVRPELDGRAVRRLSRAGMRSYMRYFGEAFALSTWSHERIDARVRAVGRENVDVHLVEGRQVILALGHCGNWDLAGAWAERHLSHVTTVAERLKPEELFQEFLRFREGVGMRIIALGDGDVFRELVRTARTGPGVLPLLADRDLTARGVEVDLFGHRARVAAGPAALAVTTGAPLVTTWIHHERLRGAARRAAGSPWGLVLEFSPAVAVPDGVPRAERVRVATQAWVDQLADGIHRRPQDWHMLQKVFVEDLDAERYAATLARESATGAGAPAAPLAPDAAAERA